MKSVIWLQQNYSLVASSTAINVAEKQKFVFSHRSGEGGTFPRNFLCLLWCAWWDLLLCWQQTPITQQERAPAHQGWLGPAAAQGHSWQTWILAHHSSVAISCYFLDPSLWCWNFIFSSVFCWCTPEHNLLILVFPPGRVLAHLSSRCTPFLSELPAKSLDLAAINLTELVNGMLSTALRGKGTGLGRSQLPAQHYRRKELREKATSVSRRSCKRAVGLQNCF